MSDLNKVQSRFLNVIKKKTQGKFGGRLYIDDLSMNLAEFIKSNAEQLNGYSVAIISDSVSHGAAASLRNNGNDKILFLFAGGLPADSYFSSCADQITFPNATFDKAEKSFFSKSPF